MNYSRPMNFARRLIYLKKQPLDFSGRPYLPAIYGSTARNLVVRASRQVEKSTFLANTILYLSTTCPRIQIRGYSGNAACCVVGFPQGEAEKTMELVLAAPKTREP